MNEHPMPFSNAMIRAILSGRKTQTRRIIPNGLMICLSPEDEPETFVEWCKYGKAGDRLWVREQLRRCQDSEGSISVALYDTDRSPVLMNGRPVEWKWQRNILTARFMPRRASRISLEITRIRVERVQGIQRDDAKAEGVDGIWDWKGKDDTRPFERCALNPYVANYSVLWDSLNAGRGYGWSVNPWVWVIEFKRVEVNDNDAANAGATSEAQRDAIE